MIWDIIFFSETRASTASVILDGCLRLHTVHGNDAEVASSVSILVHVKYARAVIAIHRCSDRVMGIDLKFGYQTIRMISVYMYHSDITKDMELYISNLFMTNFMDCYMKQSACIIESSLVATSIQLLLIIDARI